MATDKEILKLWKNMPKNLSQDEMAVRIYREAEKTGTEEGLAAMEKKLLSDSNIEASAQMLGLGRKMKAGTITLRAIIREDIRLAIEKIGEMKK